MQFFLTAKDIKRSKSDTSVHCSSQSIWFAQVIQSSRTPTLFFWRIRSTDPFGFIPIPLYLTTISLPSCNIFEPSPFALIYCRLPLLLQKENCVQVLLLAPSHQSVTSSSINTEYGQSGSVPNKASFGWIPVTFLKFLPDLHIYFEMVDFESCGGDARARQRIALLVG